MKKQILFLILIVCIIGATSYSQNEEIDYQRLFSNVKSILNPFDIDNVNATQVGNSQELTGLFEMLRFSKIRLKK